jgi:fibronectin type 3 domain-containing protein
VRIGTRDFASYFQGAIDDVRFYNRVLSLAEIQQLFTEGSGSMPPAMPTGLAATAGNNQVGLAWSASAGATGYNVKRSMVSGSGYGTIATPTATSHTDATAVNGTTYFYVVSAVNGAGESLNSSEVWATPQPPPLPSVPIGLAATGGKKKITLTWTAAAGATSYNVKRSSTNGGPYTTVATGITATTFANTGLATGSTYYYVVSAVNAGGESANSGQASATAK